MTSSPPKRVVNPYEGLPNTVRVSIDVPVVVHERLKSLCPQNGFIKSVLSTFYAKLAKDTENWTYGDQEKFIAYADKHLPGLFQ